MSTEIMKLHAIVSRGLEEGQVVRVRLVSGAWSKPYPVVGSMWRSRGYTTFVARKMRRGDHWNAGRRYLDPMTEVAVSDD